MHRIFGLVLFVVGIVLLFMGIHASESVGSDISRLFTGKPTDKAIWLVVGGVLSIILGAGGLVVYRGQPSRS